MAWREKRRIHWKKALTPGEVNHLIQKVPGELVIHFRWASVGGIEPLLCHPFPVTAEAAAQYNIRTTVVPAQSTIPALVDAIVDYFARQKEEAAV